MEDHVDWNTVFHQRRPLFESMTLRMADLVATILKNSDIDYVQIEKRAKDPESFSEKVRRKSYADPLKEMTDLVGIRIITYYLEDVDRVEDLLRAEFLVDEKNPVDKSLQMSPNQFGYLSRHFVLQLAGGRAELPEWRTFRGIKAEIQVRTALQHAWAAVNHKLEYKRAEDVPYELRRGLNRLSAIFELADTQFSQFRSSSEIIDRKYRESVDRGEKAIPLNANSLHAYLEESGLLEKFARIQVRFGTRVLEDRNLQMRVRQQLLRKAEACGLETIEAFENALDLDEADIDRVLMTATPLAKAANNWSSEDVPEVLMDDLLTVRFPQADYLLSEDDKLLAIQIRNAIPDLIEAGGNE